MINAGNRTYWPEPYSMLELPSSFRPGLAALGTLAAISVTALVVLMSFILYRLAPRKVTPMTGGSQCVILILNLLLADMQQAVALTISFHWLRLNAILAPSTPCTLQGWLLHAGDVSSGFFVLAIALHTYLITVREMAIKSILFYAAIGFIWLFSFFLASLGVAMHRYSMHKARLEQMLTLSKRSALCQIGTLVLDLSSV